MRKMCKAKPIEEERERVEKEKQTEQSGV